MSSADPPLESPPCLLCGQEDFDLDLADVRDVYGGRPGSFHIQRCRACGLRMTRPRPTTEGLAVYYQGTYSDGEHRGGIDLDSFYEGRLGRTLNELRAATVEKVRRPSAADRVLDVGCSYGWFLALARERWGVSTVGVDLDAGSIAQALEPERCTYHVGRLPDLALAERSFTVVTFLECLEHEQDPLAALQEAWRLLEPGGLCLVEVPSWRSPWRALFGRWWLPLLIPQHLTHFDPRTLRAMLERAGFEVVHWQSMLLPLPLTITLAALLCRLTGLSAEHAVVKLFTALTWSLVDVPTQFALRLLGLGGHQAAIGRKPVNTRSDEDQEAQKHA